MNLVNVHGWWYTPTLFGNYIFHLCMNEFNETISIADNFKLCQKAMRKDLAQCFFTCMQDTQPKTYFPCIGLVNVLSSSMVSMKT